MGGGIDDLNTFNVSCRYYAFVFKMCVPVTAFSNIPYFPPGSEDVSKLERFYFSLDISTIQYDMRFPGIMFQVQTDGSQITPQWRNSPH